MNDQASNYDAGAPMPHGLRAPGGAPAATAAPSLDTKGQNPTDASGGSDCDWPRSEKEKIKKEKNENEIAIPAERPRRLWDRKQKRAYQKAITLFNYWHTNGYQVFFVTLTGAPDSS